MKLNLSARLLPLARFTQADDGFVLPYVAVILVGLLGMIGLGIDVGRTLMLYQQMQTAADTACFNGEVALLAGGSSTTIAAEGKAASASAGFQDGVNGVTVAVNTGSGILAPSPYAGNTKAVQAVISGSVATYFAKFFGTNSYAIGAQATCTGNQTNYCILALNEDASPGLSLKGGPTVGNPSCGIAVNAEGSNAALFSGSGNIYGPLSVAGGVTFNGASFNIGYTVPPFPDYGNNLQVADPYASTSGAWVNGTTFPSTACTTTVAAGQTLSGGATNLCALTANGVMTLTNGVYVVNDVNNKGNSIDLSGSGSIVTTNATIIVKGNVDLKNNSVNLSAPTASSASIPSGAVNIALTSPNGVTFNSGGSGAVILNGVLYLPNTGSSVTMSGGTNHCAQIIAGSITLSGTIEVDTTALNCNLKNISSSGSAKVVQ